MRQEEKIDKILEFTSKMDKQLAVVISDQKHLSKEIEGVKSDIDKELRPEVKALVGYKNRAVGVIWLGAIILSTAISLIVKFA